MNDITLEFGLIGSFLGSEKCEKRRYPTSNFSVEHTFNIFHKDVCNGGKFTDICNKNTTSFDFIIFEYHQKQNW